jgi:hypothetical protein
MSVYLLLLLPNDRFQYALNVRSTLQHGAQCSLERIEFIQRQPKSVPEGIAWGESYDLFTVSQGCRLNSFTGNRTDAISLSLCPLHP